MARSASEEAIRRRETVRDRIRFLLEYRWAGNQRQMARDLAVSQGLISKIVNGLQGAGKRFLTTLARQPGVNGGWVLRGEGQPLSLPPKGTLPIALGVLPGMPSEHAHLLTGQRHPVAEALDRATRYWLELQSASPLLRDGALRLLTGDLLLVETDPAWTSRPDLIVGRLCGVRCGRGSTEPAYALGKLYRDPPGLVFDAIDSAIRLVGSPAPTPRPTVSPKPTASGTPASPNPTASGTPADETNDFHSKRKRRTIRMLDKEEEKEKKRRLHAQELSAQRELAGQQSTVKASDEGNDTFSPQDIVGVCLYLVRPSPGLGPLVSAAEEPSAGRP